MARRILLITLVAALLGLTTTAWAGAPTFEKADKANDLIQKVAKCPGANCGANCQLKNWLNANVAKRKIIGKSDCFRYVGTDLLQPCKDAIAAIPDEFTCKKGVVVAIAKKAPCPLLGKKISKKEATSASCDCPKGTHTSKDGLRCECDEKELTGTFVVAGQNADKVCMTKAEIADAKKRRNEEARRLAALKDKKAREAYEAAKRWNPYHQKKLHPDEDGYYDTCPADISEKVECKTPDFEDYVCLCKNCPDYFRDELTPSDPWVLKAGEREECPNWFAYLLATIGWLGVIGIPLFLIILGAVIFFFITRRKKKGKTPPKDPAPGAPTGTGPTSDSDGEVPPLPPVDAASFEALEAKLIDKFTSSDEGGFLHPEHPFMTAVLAKLGATMVSRTDFDEALEAPPESLLEAVIAYLKPELVRDQSRELFADIIMAHRGHIEELTKQIDVKAQGESADPAQLQALEIQRRVHQTCLSEAEDRDRLLAGIDDEDDS